MRIKLDKRLFALLFLKYKYSRDKYITMNLKMNNKYIYEKNRCNYE